jgi:hypothetical protein
MVTGFCCITSIQTGDLPHAVRLVSTEASGEGAPCPTLCGRRPVRPKSGGEWIYVRRPVRLESGGTWI